MGCVSDWHVVVQLGLQSVVTSCKVVYVKYATCLDCLWLHNALCIVIALHSLLESDTMGREGWCVLGVWVGDCVGVWVCSGQ